MLTQQIIRDVGPDGSVCFNLPDLIGKKVRIIFSTVTDTYTGNKTEMDDDQEFNAAAYLAVVEDDEAEDAIWEKYIK
jgi:hypothetical protein